jgi:hypothetical protein
MAGTNNEGGAMPQTWEYHLEGLGTYCATEPDSALALPDPGGATARRRTGEVVRRLNELGAEGWEVIAVYPWTPGWGYLFKRPAPDREERI